MKICIATSNYFPDTGGISTYSRSLATLLAITGHKGIVLTIDINAMPDENDTVETDKNGVVIIRLKKSFHNYYNYYNKYFKQGNIDAPYWIAMGLAMQDWITANQNSYKIDIIEASAFGGLGSFFKNSSFPPVILSGHGTFFQYKRINNNKADEQTKLVEKLERFAFAYADGIISHSPQSKNDIEQFSDLNIFLARFPFIQEQNYLLFNSEIQNNIKKYALVVGSLQQLKGTFVLFDSIANIYASLDDFTIIWAGSDNYYHETGQLMSVELEKRYPAIWNKKIIWEKNPADNKLITLYQNAAFIIIPTIWESYNVISNEAAFFNKPAIITKTTGSSFLFTHEENALIIEQNSIKALAKAILQLYNDPKLCRKMGEAAYETVSNHLDPNKITEERINIYQLTIQNRTKKEAILDTSFLKKYTKAYRKVYFSARKILKRIFKN